MIATLTAALVLVAAVVAVQAVVLVLLVRRLREVEAQLSPESYLPETGRKVGDFAVPATDGTELTQADLSGENVVAMLAAGCPSCPGLLAELATARAGHERGDTIVFTVTDDPEDPDAVELAGKAAPFALAAVTGYGPVPRAFGVSSFPILMLVRDGVVTRAGHSPGELSGVD